MLGPFMLPRLANSITRLIASGCRWLRHCSVSNSSWKLDKNSWLRVSRTMFEDRQRELVRLSKLSFWWRRRIWLEFQCGARTERISRIVAGLYNLWTETSGTKSRLSVATNSISKGPPADISFRSPGSHLLKKKNPDPMVRYHQDSVSPQPPI